MAKAVLLYHDKADWPDGSIVEMTIWRLPTVSKERPHGLKYSLFYGRPDQRIIGYDNESGKGDHRHYGDVEQGYRFTDVEILIADFIADVRKERGDT
jgi:uncharacterized protein YwbE